MGHMTNVSALDAIRLTGKSNNSTTQRLRRFGDMETPKLFDTIGMRIYAVSVKWDVKPVGMKVATIVGHLPKLRCFASR